MRVIFLWSDISGYMAACWKQLSDALGGQLHVMAKASSGATAFDTGLMAGVQWTPLTEEQRSDTNYLAARVRDFDPSVVVISGWAHRAYQELVYRPEVRGRRVVMCMDTPWRGTPRQHMARIVLRRYLARINDVVVTGERSWQFARRLGFSEERVHRCLYGIDFESLSSAAAVRLPDPSARQRFLFVGRYVPSKGIDTMVSAYVEYRRSVPDPWPLVCCGRGPMQGLLAQQPGVSDLGFHQPSEVYRLMADSGALVLPSRFEPWGVVVAEASGAKLPVICSNACGAAVEIVRDGYTGFTFATGSASDLARVLLRVHECPTLEVVGERAQAFAAAYSATEWTRKWLTAFGSREGRPAAGSRPL